MNLVGIIKENRFLKPIYSQLTKVIEVVPYYLFEEGLRDKKKLELKPKLENFSIDFLDILDIKTIATHPEVDETEEELLERFSNGCLCLGVKSNGDIAAYTWCNLQYCSYEKRLYFPLEDNEAYLFDARTFKNYRGKALAPYLRYQLYLKLEKMGKSKCYSVTSTLNTSAIRFKEKLQARILKLYLFIKIFGKIKMNIPVRKFSN